MGFLGFLTRKNFYIHIGISIVVTLIIVLISFRVIKSYTRHGEALVLPDFTGLTLDQLEEKGFTESFDFMVTDSVFANELQPGSIVKQNPSPQSKVKQGRKVYITTVAMMPEMTIMPDLRDLTVRQAVSILKSNGLKIRKMLFIGNMADNAVVGHYFNEDTLLAGDELLSGSEIDLMIGLSDNNPARVPFVVGKDEESAIDLLHVSGFNVGRIIYWDSLARVDGKVYRQSSGWEEALARGEWIDIWLKSTREMDFDSLVEALLPDSTVLETLNPVFPEDTVIFEE